MALNAMMVGMKNGKGGMVMNPAMKPSFQTIALPVAKRKKMGVIAMKISAQEGLIGQASFEKLMYYSLSLPVTLVTVGMPKPEFIDQNVAGEGRLQANAQSRNAGAVAAPFRKE